MAHRDLKTFNFDNVAAAVNGVLVSGLWEGDDVITIEQNSPLTNNIVGAGGDVLISVSTDKATKVTLKLQHVSETHAALTALLIQYEQGNPSLFSFACNDVGTGEGGGAGECVLMDKPTVGFGAQATVREWTFFCANWESNNVTYNGL